MLNKIKTLCAGSFLAAVTFFSVSVSTGQADIIHSLSVDNTAWDSDQFKFMDGSTWLLTDGAAPYSKFYFGVAGGTLNFFRSTDEVTASTLYTGNNSTTYFGQSGALNFGAVEGADNWVYLKSAEGNFGWMQVYLNSGNPTASYVIQYVYDNTGAHINLQDAIAAIPEPSSVMLLGLLGSGALISAVRRQRRK